MKQYRGGGYSDYLVWIRDKMVPGDNCYNYFVLLLVRNKTICGGKYSDYFLWIQDKMVSGDNCYNYVILLEYEIRCY